MISMDSYFNEDYTNMFFISPNQLWVSQGSENCVPLRSSGRAVFPLPNNTNKIVHRWHFCSVPSVFCVNRKEILSPNICKNFICISHRYAKWWAFSSSNPYPFLVSPLFGSESPHAWEEIGHWLEHHVLRNCLTRFLNNTQRFPKPFPVPFLNGIGRKPTISLCRE